jgi:hypothetical protein
MRGNGCVQKCTTPMVRNGLVKALTDGILYGDEDAASTEVTRFPPPTAAPIWRRRFARFPGVTVQILCGTARAGKLGEQTVRRKQPPMVTIASTAVSDRWLPFAWQTMPSVVV